ncbi:hypothetical protein BgiMline_003080 [Biomphalaria glabrata]|uniref:Uncharacterized protein LOC106061048 n=1 Tax=Biomphalaria glabrata TaxID=6526 RepID=A0A9U8E749_BIOGL|nr:uncharacterized protein LOC106061048 [Biomphalaria glabrata]
MQCYKRLPILENCKTFHLRTTASMATQQTIRLKQTGRCYRLVPTGSITTRTDKILTETKKTSVRHVKVVTTSRQGGQKVVSVDKKVVTTTSTTNGQVILRQMPHNAMVSTDDQTPLRTRLTSSVGSGELRQHLKNDNGGDVTDQEVTVGGSSFLTHAKSHAHLSDDKMEVASSSTNLANESCPREKDIITGHVVAFPNTTVTSRGHPFYTVREYTSNTAGYDQHLSYSMSSNNNMRLNIHNEREANNSLANGNSIYKSNIASALPIKAESTATKNAPKASLSFDVASSSSTVSAPDSTCDSDPHKNGTQRTSEMIARNTTRKTAYVRPGLVGNRFAGSQPTRCDGSADVMRQTSAADGSGAKRPFLDMRSIWDIGQPIVSTRSPRKPITCYKDYIS